MLMSTVGTARVIVSSVIMNLREETSMRMRMILDASHVASGFVKMVFSFDFFPYGSEHLR